MTSITHEQFEAQVPQQKLNAIKWHELQDGTIYTIDKAEFINTQYGEPCILTVTDENEVFAPSALINHVKIESHKPFPRYVRTKGRVQ